MKTSEEKKLTIDYHGKEKYVFFCQACLAIDRSWALLPARWIYGSLSKLSIWVSLLLFAWSKSKMKQSGPMHTLNGKQPKNTGVLLYQTKKMAKRASKQAQMNENAM